jgi:membrane-associated phospholipid phosphatase
VRALIVAVAQDLLPVLGFAAALVWVTRDRAGKVALAGQAAVGLLLVGVGIWLAGTLHVDPRPFVQDPSSPPLFPHAADNGFPSDHGAAGGLLAALVTRHKRVVGAVVAAGAVLIAAARVAAHVHHVQDVVAGLAIGAAAGVLAVWIINRIVAMRARRADARGAQPHPQADHAGRPHQAVGRQDRVVLREGAALPGVRPGARRRREGDAPPGFAGCRDRSVK